jgi:hypothetical protein
MNDRGLEQFLYVFNALQEQARTVLPQKFPELGQLVAIDGSLIDSVLSITWADYRGGAKKAKTHIGFDINRGILRKIVLTAGNDGKRQFVSRILLPGETGVLNRGYQQHKNFDLSPVRRKALRLSYQSKYHKNMLGKGPSMKRFYCLL